MSRTATCKVCGTALHRRASADGREWVWVDSDGSGTHSRYPFNPYEELNRLAAVTVPAKKADSAAYARYGRAMEAYSRLLVDLDFGGWYASHLPIDISSETYPDRPADHCGEPPYLPPSGWECRKCKIPLEAVNV